MAKIEPIRPGGTQLTTEVGEVKEQPQIESTTGRMFTNIGNTTTEIADKLEKAQSLAEHTKAQNILETNVAKIEAQAAYDQDISPENHKKYHDALDKAKEESAKGISIPATRDAFMSEATHRSEIGKIKVNSIFTDKMIKNAAEDFKTFMDNQMHKYSATTNPAELENALLQRDNKLAQMVGAGYISKSEADYAKVQSKDKWDDANIKYNSEVRPQWALDELEKGEKGFYAGVNQTVRAKGIEEARKSVKRQEGIAKNKLTVQQHAGYRSAFEKYMSGGLNPVDVESMEYRGDLTPEKASVLYKAMKATPVVHKDPKSYMDVVHTMLDSKNEPDEIMDKMVNMNSAGKLSADDMKRLYALKVIPNQDGSFDSLAEKEGPDAIKKDLVSAQNREGWRGALNMIKNFVAQAPSYLSDVSGNTADLTKKAIDAFSKGNVSISALPNLVNDLIRQTIIQGNPFIAAANKAGELMVDAYGRRATVYPDGRIESIPEPGPEDKSTDTDDEEEEKKVE